MDRLTIEQLDPLFPEKRLIDQIPEDTQIVILGEHFCNTYHQQYLYLNLPDFAAKGFSLAIARQKDQEPGARHILGNLGYRPHQMQRFRHMHFPNDHIVLRGDEQDKTVFNPFRDMPNAVGQFKLMRGAQRLGMNFSFIEDPKQDMTERLGFAMARRCNYMASEIARQAQNGQKIIVDCPNDFLYSVFEFEGCKNSLQKQLRDSGFKTHAIALLHEPGELIKNEDEIVAYDFIEAADENAAAFIHDYIESQISNPEDLDDDNAFDTTPQFNSLTKAFFLNARLATKKAGTILPDEFLVFPQASFDDVFLHMNGLGAKTNPIIESEVWERVWLAHGIHAHNEYKQQRKNAL